MNKTPGKRYQDALPRIKKNVEKARLYFEPNYKRFNEFRNFVFNSTLSDEDRALLNDLQKPVLEFNIQEAYISRLRGEFAKYEPSIVVSAQDGKQVDPVVLHFYEDHIRHILTEANNNGCEYNVYTDTLSGGFSAFKIWTEYANEKSFDQNIKFGRVFDPCLTGHDPLAQMPHKGDGQYCFELFPKTKEDFENEYPDIDLREIKFSGTLEGFSWSYSSDGEKILLICDYYEKKKKKMKIHQLPNNVVVTDEKYKELLKMMELTGDVRQAPVIVQSRMADVQVICRYRFIENKVIEYVETDFKELPIPFVDGNSVILRDSPNNAAKQMTRPYVYHAKGIQKLKNFAGQSLANELENMVQHKFMIAKEAIPNGYEDAYTDVQLPSTIVYNAFNNNNPTQPLPAPQPIARPAIPAEISSTFGMADQVTQSILGSYDPQIGNLNESQLSGVAIIESASMGNAAAMPYIVGFLQGLNQVAQILVDLIPKYYVTPRTVPVMDKEGKKSYVKLNQPGGISLNHDDNAINVKVEAGVSFGIQKSRALQQITALMQVSPTFQQFMNAQGLPILLDNIEIRGIDQLKSSAQQFMAKMQKQQAMAQQMQQQQVTPAQVQMAKLQYQQHQDQVDNQLRAEELTTARIKVMGDIQTNQQHNQVQAQKAQAENYHSLIEQARETEDMTHRHMMESMDMSHQHAKGTFETLHKAATANQAASQPAANP
jgi:hypothetical protein